MDKPQNTILILFYSSDGFVRGVLFLSGISIFEPVITDINTIKDWFGRVTQKSLDIDIISDDGNFYLDSAIEHTYADTDTTATTKVTSLTSSVTNGTNEVSEQEYYEYDSVGNITGIYRLEENEKIYYNRYYYDEANGSIRHWAVIGSGSMWTQTLKSIVKVYK